jgi:hypothetical protein
VVELLSVLHEEVDGQEQQQEGAQQQVGGSSSNQPAAQLGLVSKEVLRAGKVK